MATFNYKIKLFSLMEAFPGYQANVGQILESFERNFGGDMPPEYHELNKSNRIRWRHTLHIFLSMAKRDGEMDQPQHGTWHLTETGRSWLNRREHSHPDITSGATREIEAHRPSSRRDAPSLRSHKLSPRLGRDGRFNYRLKLLALLAQVPHQQGKASLISKLFVETYRHEMTSEHFEVDAGGLERWKHSLSGAVAMAKREGLLDNYQRGYYRLTASGQHWLSSMPDAPRITVEPDSLLEGVGTDSIPPIRISPSASSANIGRRHAILDDQVDVIRAYLDGRSESRPSSERLCDWVHFCYTYELYGEGRDLFALVTKEEVNAWYFERTRKLAHVCAIKAG